jgi:hypothetical protein
MFLLSKLYSRYVFICFIYVISQDPEEQAICLAASVLSPTSFSYSPNTEKSNLGKDFNNSLYLSSVISSYGANSYL